MLDEPASDQKKTPELLCPDGDLLTADDNFISNPSANSETLLPAPTNNPIDTTAVISNGSDLIQSSQEIFTNQLNPQEFIAGHVEETGNISKSPLMESKDNGIFEFMSPDRAIELYNRIHNSGPPALDWKFYGRRKPGEIEGNEMREASADKDELQSNDDPQNCPTNTPFDFDEEISDLQMDTTLVNESLCLKQRAELGSERKTNLSDIMIDIMKESQADTS